MTIGLPRRLGVATACGVLTVLVGPPPTFADSIRDRQWHLKALNVDAAQKINKGAGVVVAVIDTGVNANHRDLAGNILPGADFIASGTRGWTDTDGHGTAMAGLIAGHGHGAASTDGVLGIAPAAKVLPIRVLKGGGRAPADVGAAIDEAVKRGAEVISMSFEITTTTNLERALDKALKANVILVAGTGNRPDEVLLQYPAKYPGVVAVGATGRDGKLASFSVTGKEVTLVAPGAGITSTSNSGAYRSADGTSDSAAIVAGAAALVRSKYPDLSATEVVHRLTATATDKGAPGRDSDYGYGELNLVAALTADVPPATARPSTATSGSSPATGGSADAAPPSGGVVRIDWFAVGVALFAFLLLVGLIVWVVRRERGRRGPSGGGGYRALEQRAGENQRHDP